MFLVSFINSLFELNSWWVSNIVLKKEWNKNKTKLIRTHIHTRIHDHRLCTAHLWYLTLEKHLHYTILYDDDYIWKKKVTGLTLKFFLCKKNSSDSNCMNTFLDVSQQYRLLRSVFQVGHYDYVMVCTIYNSNSSSSSNKKKQTHIILQLHKSFLIANTRQYTKNELTINQSTIL